MLKMARYVIITGKCDFLFNFLYRKHAKVNESGVKTKPAELSQDDVEAAKKEWENIILSEGEDEM